jgi:DNA-binding NarL/FixJ family response regulator
MKVVLADDHALFRAGLRSALIEAFGEEAEILEVSDFAGLREVLNDTEDLDLILCDLFMPGMDPAEGIRSLVGMRPQTPLVVVSASKKPADARRSIQQGARGYILKSDSLAVLERALELVLAGGAYAPVSALMAPEDTADVAQNTEAAASGSGEAPIPALSRRQMMIFERLADGKPNKLIARELGIAEGTVKAQLRTVFRKLGVHNRTQAALFAAEFFGKEHYPGAGTALGEAGAESAGDDEAPGGGTVPSDRLVAYGRAMEFDISG